MRKGYKRILIFELIIFVILLLNSFVSSILSNFKMFAFLLAIAVIFKFLFGYEKDKSRFRKDILLEEVIFLLIFFLLYYLSGLFFGFARTGNTFLIRNDPLSIVALILIIITKEVLRYMILTKSEGCKTLTVTTCILFIMFDITAAIYYGSFRTSYETFEFIALTLLPAISTNVLCTYLVKKTGFRTSMFYVLVMNLYTYILPIIPNPNKYIVSIIRLVVPMLLLYRVFMFFNKVEDEEIDRDYNKKRFGLLIVPTLITIFLVYITSGYFHYHAIAVASGSMSPEIHKGDVVIVEKVDNHFEEIEKGQVIAVKYNNVIIIHRLVEKLKVDDEYYFYTKGDANAEVDNWTITEDMILGVVNIKVPYIGLPTVWLNEL